MCGETMRLVTHKATDRIPGHSQASVHVLHEWICPECDYFEEAEAGEE